MKKASYLYVKEPVPDLPWMPSDKLYKSCLGVLSCAGIGSDMEAKGLLELPTKQGATNDVANT